MNRLPDECQFAKLFASFAKLFANRLFVNRLDPPQIVTVRDGAIEIGSARAVGLISEIEGEIGRSVGPISRRFL